MVTSLHEQSQDSLATQDLLAPQTRYVLKSQDAKVRDGIFQDPIIILVDQILYKAVSMRASDIHLEPLPYHLRLRYRIDGVLYDQEPIPLQQSSLILSRLKILSSLDIAQRRIPQDGKLILRFISDDSSFDREIDLRISTFPCVHGEKLVIRILDRLRQSLSLETLGCDEDTLKTIRSLISRPHGFFLVTGPTGSGKTTTLYAILSRLNQPGRNIVTMEDPVEYHLDGITQSQINEKVGFTFEMGLRALLRQDPDVAMVGEIRDRQTAQTAIEAALTGHVVLSTLHTNDSVGALTRLIDMKVEPFLITASLTGVLAQRLVRLLCPACKRKVALSERELRLVKKQSWDLQFSWKANGCSKCFHLGYKGRIGIFELLKVDDQIRDLIMHGASSDIIRFQAMQDGMRLLQHDGIEKVKAGLICFEELLRVVVME